MNPQKPSLAESNSQSPDLLKKVRISPHHSLIRSSRVLLALKSVFCAPFFFVLLLRLVFHSFFRSLFLFLAVIPGLLSVGFASDKPTAAVMLAVALSAAMLVANSAGRDSVRFFLRPLELGALFLVLNGGSLDPRSTRRPDLYQGTAAAAATSKGNSAERGAVATTPAYRPWFAHWVEPDREHGSFKIMGIHVNDLRPSDLEKIRRAVIVRAQSHTLSHPPAPLHVSVGCLEGCLLLTLDAIGPAPDAAAARPDLLPVDELLALLSAATRARVTRVIQHRTPSVEDAAPSIAAVTPPGLALGTMGTGTAAATPELRLSLCGFREDAEARDWRVSVWSTLERREIVPLAMETRFEASSKATVRLQLPPLAEFDVLKLGLKRTIVPAAESSDLEPSASCESESGCQVSSAPIFVGLEQIPVVPAAPLAALLRLEEAGDVLKDLAALLEIAASGHESAFEGSGSLDLLGAVRHIQEYVAASLPPEVAAPALTWLSGGLTDHVRGAEALGTAKPGDLAVNPAPAESPGSSRLAYGYLLEFRDGDVERAYQHSVARQEGVEEVLLYAILMPVFLGIKGPSVGVPGALIADPIGILGLMLKVFQALIVFVAPAFQARSRRFLVLLSAMDCAHVEARMTPFAANWMAQQGPARFAVECANRFVITALIAFFRRVPSKFVPIKWVTMNAMVVYSTLVVHEPRVPDKFGKAYLFTSLAAFLLGDLVGSAFGYLREKGKREKYLQTLRVPNGPSEPSPLGRGRTVSVAAAAAAAAAASVPAADGPSPGGAPKNKRA